MLLSIAAAEFRYQLRSPHGLVTFAVLFGLSFLLTANAGEFQTFAPGGLVHANAPYAITETLIRLSVFGVFAVPAFIASSVLKDVESGFDAILFATPMGKGDYLLGRFGGAFAALMASLAAAPLGLLLGTFWPWADPELLGPTRPDHYLVVFFGILLPSMAAIAAIIFAVAVASRSLIQTYLATLALLALYLVSGETNLIPPVFDPFLFEVFDAETRYWTAAERNSRLLGFEGQVLASRLLWTAIATAILTVTYRLFSFQALARKAKPAKRTTGRADPGRPAPADDAPSHLLPVGRARTGTHQFLYRTAFETRAVLRSAPFVILMALCFSLLTVELMNRELMYGVNALPVTRLMLPDTASISILVLVVLAFYSAEILWRERIHGVHEIVDALPVANSVFVGAKLAALGVIVVSIQVLAIAIALALQLLEGGTVIEWGLYLERGLWYPLLPYFCLAVLTVFFQVLAHNRYLGMLFFGLFLGAIVASRDLLGIEHPLASYVYPAIGAPLSDMNGSGRFMALGYWVRAYWASIAGLLLVLTFLLYPRGTAQPMRYRLVRLRALGTPSLAVTVVFFIASLAGTAGFIYFNTNLVNDYRSEGEVEALRVAYEKSWKPSENHPMPRTIAIDLEVDLYPGEPRMDIRSRHVLQNKTPVPLSIVHVVFPPGLDLDRIELQGGAVLELDETLVPYYVFQLDDPLSPGDSRALEYQATYAPRGFPHRSPDTRLVANGTFVTHSRLVPTIGFEPGYQIEDRRRREQLGLPPLPRRAPLDDPRQLHNHAARQDSDFIELRTTVSTEGDQTALAPGVLEREWTTAGRRFFQYRTEAPIRNFFAILSARYAVERAAWNGIGIEVFHHPPHRLNLQRLIQGVKDSLTYYTEAFGPYPFSQLRIAEFPAYREFTAQSFAGLIAYSEDEGFLADVQPGDIDMPYYVTAHEMAHQWWGHVVAGANTQGDGFIHETLAQYSALRVMARRYGEDQIRRFLKYELDRYLAGRADDPEGEQPLYQVERQAYIHYRKGSVILYALADYLGAEVVDQALRRLVEQRGFRSDPYASSTDFLRLLKDEAGPDAHGLIEDFLEKITLFDLKLVIAEVTELDDGRFDVRLQVEASKFYAETDGTETPAPLDLPIEIGLFRRSPAEPEFDSGDVILVEKRRVGSGASTLSLVVDQRPAFAGIDPYNKLIDRDSDDNLGAVR